MEQLNDAATSGNARASAPHGRGPTPEFPPELNSEDIPGALFGYDKRTVAKRLDELGARFSELWQEAAEREETIKSLEVELERTRHTHLMIGETLLAAQQQAQTIREEARRSAESLLKMARKHAEKQGEEIEQEARATAEELITAAEEERRTLLAEAGEARAFVEQTHNQLSDFLLAAVKWYEGANLSADDYRPGEPPPSLSAEEISEGQQFDPVGLDGSADPRVAEDT
jgi:cell division septum initiation protein DivIVA